MNDAGTLLRAATLRLAAAGVDTPQVDAELLLGHVCGRSRAELSHALLLGRSPFASAKQRETFAALVARREAREPLQHLTGRAPFRHLELAVGPGVFVPRPETEAVAQVAIDEAVVVVARSGSALIVDLCTGSGAIALAVADEVPGVRVHAVELDAAAHAWAARNIAEATVESNGAAVTLVRGDARTALAELDGTCDIVVSNPPYVPGDAVPKDREVADYDPAVALYGLGPDGLEVPRGVTAAAARLLRPGGLFIMEHAEVQDAAARAMVAQTGSFVDIRTHPDLTGRSRMVVARRRGAGFVEDSSS